MSSDRARHLEVVEQFFSGPRELDRLSLMSDDCEWFNGIGKFPAAPGQTVFRGKDEIGRIILGRAPSPLPLSGRKVDRYDLTTARFHDVETIADGPYVFRQHGYTATTLGGRDYANVYGFLFRFDDDGLIDRVWEHWGTLAAYEQLFQSDLVVDDPDVMLMTTPSVRLRLDLERPVPREVIEQCLDVAVHAPNGSNTQPYQFLCIDDDDRKLAIADLYRTAMQEFMDRPRTAAPEDNVDRTTERQQRIARSVFHLRDHLHEVPVLCVPIVAGRTDGPGKGAQADRTSVFWQSSRWGSVIPTLWSFMLDVALARPRLRVDDAHAVQGARDGRTARHPVRRVDAGRAVPDRVHAGHRVRGHAARAGRGNSCAGTTTACRCGPRCRRP